MGCTRVSRSDGDDDGGSDNGANLVSTAAMQHGSRRPLRRCHACLSAGDPPRRPRHRGAK